MNQHLSRSVILGLLVLTVCFVYHFATPLLLRMPIHVDSTTYLNETKSILSRSARNTLLVLPTPSHSLIFYPTEKNSLYLPSASKTQPKKPSSPLKPNKKRTKKKVVESRAFNYSAFYEPRSTLPRELKKPTTRWISGPPALQRYINEVYIPYTNNHSATGTAFIYRKRGTTGIAGQIVGSCDVLALAIAYHRPFKIIAPALPPHLFSFPLFNITYPITLPDDSEKSHLRYRTSNFTVKGIPLYEFIYGSHPDWIYKRSYDFGRHNRHSAMITSLNPMNRYIFNNNHVKRFYQSILGNKSSVLSISGPRWIAVCSQSLLQYSEFMLQFTAPYERFVEGHFLVGLHMRAGGVGGNWKDGGYFQMTGERVSAIFPAIEKLQQQYASLSIFIATDSDMLEKLVRHRFPAIVVPAPNHLQKQHVGKSASEEGIIRALFDLYFLSRSNMLYLTPKSQFSELAGWLNSENATIRFF